MKTKKKKFKLFSSCVPVKGITRATICDLQRNKIHIIPLSLYEVIVDLKKFSYHEVVNHYDENEVKIIDEYISFLLKMELGFWTDEPELFPDLEEYWESPEIINNSIIEADFISKEQLLKVLDSLKQLGCKYLEIRFYSDWDVEKVRYLLELVKSTKIKSVLIYAKHNDTIVKEAGMLFQRFIRLSLIVHSSPYITTENDNNRFCFIKKNITSNHHCGTIDPNFFSPNIQVFMESLQHNTCLNKKVSIDSMGYIKNCPSTKEIFGHIDNDDLINIVVKNEFQSLWSINKDKINICKDCEFRYVCTDCRAFLIDENDIYSKPLKCKYNPYTSKYLD